MFKICIAPIPFFVRRKMRRIRLLFICQTDYCKFFIGVFVYYDHPAFIFQRFRLFFVVRQIFIFRFNRPADRNPAVWAYGLFTFYVFLFLTLNIVLCKTPPKGISAVFRPPCQDLVLPVRFPTRNFPPVTFLAIALFSSFFL